MTSNNTNLPVSDNITTTNYICQYASDLHLERYISREYNFNDFIKPVAPILILLGDIGTSSSNILQTFLYDCSKAFTLVLYVPGNHEYYSDGLTINQINDYFTCLTKSFHNIIFMNNKTYEHTINGKTITFIGTTLWSKILSTERAYINGVSNDFKKIYVKERILLDVRTYNNFHRENVNWLIAELNKIKSANDLSVDKSPDKSVDSLTQPNNITIILSHHLPSYNLIAPKYTSHMGNSMYVTNLNYILESYSVSHWLFGHSHATVNNIISGTVCCSNPLGYKFSNIQENAEYDVSKILEII